jgi:hypothetical protein
MEPVQAGLKKAKDTKSVDRAIRAFEFVQRGPDCAVATIADHVILYWKRKVVREGANWTRRAFLDVARRLPDSKIGFFTVIDAGCDAKAGADVRDDMSELLKAYEDRIGAAAIAFEGQGFRMTMVRSIITAIALASRSRFPNSVFSKVPEAAAWMHSHTSKTGSPVDPQQLIAALEMLREPT